MPLEDWIAQYPQVQALLQQPDEVLEYTVDTAEMELVEDLYARLRVLCPTDRSGPLASDWLRALLGAEAEGYPATGPCQAAEPEDVECCGRPGILDPWQHAYACPRHLLMVFADEARRRSWDVGPSASDARE